MRCVHKLCCMSITPEVNAKTLTQLVATEVRVQMARADVRQSQLARRMGKTEQWLSVRLRGVQAFDVNDLQLVAGALGVGVHDLLPPPDVAASARSVSVPYQSLNPLVTIRTPDRPKGRRDSVRPGRTSRIPRPELPMAR